MCGWVGDSVCLGVEAVGGLANMTRTIYTWLHLRTRAPFIVEAMWFVPSRIV